MWRGADLMSYQRTTWKNRVVEKPRTFEMVDNGDGTITLVPMEGNILEPGTPIIAQNMNNIEEGIVTLEQGLVSHLAEYVSLESKTYYIDETNGSDSNNGESAATAFATWEKCYSMLPRHIEHKYIIRIIGNLNQDIVLRAINIPTKKSASDMHLEIIGHTENASNHTVRSIQQENCSGVLIKHLKIDNGVFARGGLFNCDSLQFGVTDIAFELPEITADIRNCNFSTNKVNRGINAAKGIVVSINNVGSCSQYGLYAAQGAIIAKSGNQPTGGTADEKTDTGGVIR